MAARCPAIDVIGCWVVDDYVVKDISTAVEGGDHERGTVSEPHLGRRRCPDVLGVPRRRDREDGGAVGFSLDSTFYGREIVARGELQQKGRIGEGFDGEAVGDRGGRRRHGLS